MTVTYHLSLVTIELESTNLTPFRQLISANFIFYPNAQKHTNI